MQTIGLWTGLATFLIIALFHPLVVLAEEKFSNKIWVAFLAAGILFLVLSLRTAAPLLSAVLGVLGFTCLWSIKELSDLSFPWKPRQSRPAQSAAQPVTNPLRGQNFYGQTHFYQDFFPLLPNLMKKTS